MYTIEPGDRHNHLTPKRQWNQSGINPTDIVGDKIGNSSAGTNTNFIQNFINEFVINGGSVDKNLLGNNNPARPKQYYTVSLNDTELGKDVFKEYAFANINFKEDFNSLVKDIALPDFGISGDHTYVEKTILKPTSNEISIEFLEQEQSIIDFFFLNWIEALSTTKRREVNKVTMNIEVWDMAFSTPLIIYKFLKLYPKNVGLPQLTQDGNLTMYRKVDFYFDSMLIERLKATPNEKQRSTNNTTAAEQSPLSNKSNNKSNNTNNNFKRVLQDDLRVRKEKEQWKRYEDLTSYNDVDGDFDGF